MSLCVAGNSSRKLMKELCNYVKGLSKGQGIQKLAICDPDAAVAEVKGRIDEMEHSVKVSHYEFTNLEACLPGCQLMLVFMDGKGEEDGRALRNQIVEACRSVCPDSMVWLIGASADVSHRILLGKVLYGLRRGKGSQGEVLKGVPYVEALNVKQVPESRSTTAEACPAVPREEEPVESIQRFPDLLPISEADQQGADASADATSTPHNILKLPGSRTGSPGQSVKILDQPEVREIPSRANSSAGRSIPAVSERNAMAQYPQE